MTATIEDRLVVGDASVLQELYAKHGSLIHTIAHQLQGPAADQFTSSTFVEAWQNRRDFDPSRGTVEAWLVRRLRQQMSNDRDHAAEVIDRVVVTASLARMEPDRREILLVGASSRSGAVTDLAERLNLPVGTVNSHLRRGMETLQRDLADSRSDGDASSLAGIVQSGRLEAEVVHPTPEVWQAIRAAMNEDGMDSDGDAGPVLDADVPVSPDPFGSFPDEPDSGFTVERRRAIPVLDADPAYDELGDDSPTDDEVADLQESGEESPEEVRDDAQAVEYPLDDLVFEGGPLEEEPEATPADVTTRPEPGDMSHVPPALRGPVTPSVEAPNVDEPAETDGIKLVDHQPGPEQRSLNASPDLSIGDDELPADGLDLSGREQGDTALDMSESFDERYDEADESDKTHEDATDATDDDLDRLRDHLDDPVSDGQRTTLIVAGILAALIVLVLLAAVVL